ncbi:hypothetical protein BACCAC_02333 [Bacteroides caccae ATCC 43185]|nr:hypothetical protein BACCAC_02333 [Bacteroides caccae ATCC 43185]
MKIEAFSVYQINLKSFPIQSIRLIFLYHKYNKNPGE